MNKGAFKSIFQKLLIIVFAAVCMMSFLVAGCDNTQKPSGGLEDGDGKEWTISLSSVKAKLTKNGNNYILDFSGNGAINDWTKATEVPWNKYSDKITEVTIGEGVTGIGDYTLLNTAVKSLIIPETVETVGKYALPENATVYAYESTAVDSTQNSGVTVSIYSEKVPQTYDRYWTSWGSTGNICDEPFVKETPYWHFDANNKPLAWEKIKVLFIGNSFTFYYQMPFQFDAIAEDLGYYVETYYIAVPGRTLEVHSDKTSDSGVQITALLDNVNDFDYIVLQEQSTRPYTDYDKFYNAVSKLKAQVAATQDHAQIYLYETWGSPASAGDSYEEIAAMEQKLYEAYTKAATDLNLKVTYVGRAFTAVKGETDLNLYHTDNRHPGPVGSYLSACTHVASMLGGDVRNTVLTGKDMVVIANEGATAKPTSLTEEQAEILRAIAYRTVFGNEQEETYTVNFWYNGQLQSSETATRGVGFTMPTCTVENGEKFVGWTLKDNATVYAPNSSVSYSAIRGNIEDGVINFYAQTRATVIAVWGRWITESNFRLVMEGFEPYCDDNGLDYAKVGFIYYQSKQNSDPYYLIANFTAQVAKDGADIVFPCGDNIKTSADSKVADLVIETKKLGVSVEGNTTRYIAKLSDNAYTNAFYVYVTTDEAKAILQGLK